MANEFSLEHTFSQQNQEVVTYLSKVFNRSIEYYRDHYIKHPELTVDINQDLDALAKFFQYLEEYLYYYDQFYPNEFTNIFNNLQRKLEIVTVSPKNERGLYGRSDEELKMVLVNPSLGPSASLTGDERTRLYMCHELGHIINSDWMNTVEEHIVKSGKNNNLLQLMYAGFSLLDEATTQNRAEAITYYFAGKQRNDLKNYRGRLFGGEIYRSNFDFYGEFQELAIAFSKTLRGSGGKNTSDDDAMRLLSIRTLDRRFVDKVFYEYEKDGKLSELYNMLIYMGAIKKASYASFGVGNKEYISMSKPSKDAFMKIAPSLYDSRLPYQY